MPTNPGRFREVEPSRVADIKELWRGLRFGEAALEKAYGQDDSCGLRAHLPGLVGSAWALETRDWVMADPGSSELVEMLRESRTSALRETHQPRMMAKQSFEAPVFGSASHLPQAAGVGWAIRYRGQKSCVVALFDRSAFGTADFHNGLNFAAVYSAPALFVCRGLERDGGLDRVLGKGAAYGIPAEAVEAGDPLAVLEALREAMTSARSGGGPALLGLVDSATACTANSLRVLLEASGAISAPEIEEVEALAAKLFT